MYKVIKPKMFMSYGIIGPFLVHICVRDSYVKNWRAFKPLKLFILLYGQ